MEKTKIIKYKKIIFAIIVIFSFAIIAGKTQASLVDNVIGWLWGGGAQVGSYPPADGTHTNFGIVSMNSVNCDANGDGQSDGIPADCPPIGTVMANYGVNIPLADDPLTGQAWSENVGWIDFAPDGDFVAYPGCGFPKTPCLSVQRNGTNLQGWARITKIANAYAVGNSGDWQGWIRMSSDASDPIPYGVSLITAALPKLFTLSGHGWSDELGWIDFSQVSVSKLPKLIICNQVTYLNTVEPGNTAQLEAWYWDDPTATSDCNHASEANGALNVTNNSMTSWSSNNTDVVTVDSVGNITAGTVSDSTTIHAVYNSVTATALATVNVGTICIDLSLRNRTNAN